MKNILFFLSFILITFSCGNNPGGTSTAEKAPANPDDSGISFENEQVIDNNIFYIKYPGNWKPGAGGQAKTEFVLNAPQIPGGDISRESVHLMKRSLEGKPIGDFMAMTMNQYQQEIHEFEIIASAKNEFTFLGGPVENKAKYRHQFIEKDGIVYILGYSAGLKDWSTYETTADEMMQTFRLK